MNAAIRFAAGMNLVVALLGCASNPAPPPDAGHDPPSLGTNVSPGVLTDARVRTLFPTLMNGACPASGVMTGGQIDSAGLATLAREGVRTVLDLRADDEDRGFDEARVTRDAGIDYVHLPVTSETLDDRLFDRFRMLLLDDARAPFFVHCASGNRVAVALIPHLVLDRRMPVDSALAVARRVGLKDSPMVETALDDVARHPVDH